MKLAGVVLIVVSGCGKHSGASGSSSAVATGSAVVAPGSGSSSAASANTGSAGSAAALPPLGPPPKGMDATAAAACDRGDAAACVAAARSFEPKGAYRADLGIEEGKRREAGTTKYGQRACELGNGEGCALVAMFGGGGMPMLQRACDLGYLGSCGSIGLFGIRSSHTTAGWARYAPVLEKACRADTVDWDPDTAHHGGFCYELYVVYRDKLNDKPKATEFLKLACAQGEKRDCPCKEDTDCGPLPDDVDYTLTCSPDTHTCTPIDQD
jgi:hypothetical protein